MQISTLKSILEEVSSSLIKLNASLQEAKNEVEVLDNDEISSTSEKLKEILNSSQRDVSKLSDYIKNQTIYKVLGGRGK